MWCVGSDGFIKNPKDCKQQFFPGYVNAPFQNFEKSSGVTFSNQYGYSKSSA